MPDQEEPALLPLLRLVWGGWMGTGEIKDGLIEGVPWQNIVTRWKGEVWHCRAGRKRWKLIKEAPGDGS